MALSDDELIGVPRARAARIIDIPEHRLRRWEKSGLVVPAVEGRIGNRRYVAFGLEDLIQGRVVKELEAARSTFG